MQNPCCEADKHIFYTTHLLFILKNILAKSHNYILNTKSRMYNLARHKQAFILSFWRWI